MCNIRSVGQLNYCPVKAYGRVEGGRVSFYLLYVVMMITFMINFMKMLT